MLAALANFAVYFGVGITLLFCFQLTYMAFTPYKETELIKGGNTAAATAYVGAIAGFVLPLASALAHSISLLDFALWGIVAGIVQVGVYAVVRLFYRDLADSIVAGKLSQAIKLAGVSVAVGILNAASMTY